MDRQTKKTLGSAAVAAFMVAGAVAVLLGSWIYKDLWRMLATAVVLGVVYLGAILTAQWADRA